ncbi:MAG: S41 family peptidase [Acidobacteria bacterium]|nr:S41 family peptidase [Acidobacteriota bacterium]
MKRFFAVFFLLLCPTFAALTKEQKIFDVTVLAQTFAANYGPYHWKVRALKFDAMDLKPWLAKVEATKDDLEFLDVLIDYVASLQDGHSSLSFFATFRASLGFSTDLYDGKVLIDSISRKQQPLSRFPAVIGDELVSMDGVPVSQLLDRLSKYQMTGNPRATRRQAANLLTIRPQSLIPTAAALGDTVEVEVRRAATDELEKYTLPWTKTGIPFTDLGRVPTARSTAKPVVRQLELEDDTLPPYMRPLAPLLNARLPRDPEGVLNYGSVVPIYAFPTGFRLRLAGGPDFFASGTYVAEGKTLGWIRIPSFSPPSTALALQLFEREMAFLQENTSGLVIDVMRNPGGSVNFAEALLQRVIPNPFRTIGYEIRATNSWVQSFGSALSQARQFGVEPWIVQHLENNYNDLLQANREGGITGSLSFNSTGSLILLPAPVTYRKPLIVLVDDFSASGGDIFPAVMQDNARGKIVGYRTMGAGGNVFHYDGTVYSQVAVSVTQSLMTRREPIVTTDLPTAPYIENIGVRPDIELDYMTRENLMNRGTPFVNAFTRILLDQIGN